MSGDDFDLWLGGGFESTDLPEPFKFKEEKPWKEGEPWTPKTARQHKGGTVGT